MYIINFVFKVLINLSVPRDFPHYVLNTFLCHFILAMISLVYNKTCCLYPTIF